MEVNLGIWAGTFLLGAVLGIFVRPRHVGILTVVFEIGAIAGLVFFGAMLRGDLTMLFGIVAMAVPFLGALATSGAALSFAVRRARTRDKR